MADGSDAKEVGRRLRQLRGERSLQDFAGELGVSHSEYFDYEIGKREISASVLIALLERGAVDPAWVLTGRRVGTADRSAKAAGTAYAAILEAAQRAGITLAASDFAYAVRAAWPITVRGKQIEAAHADVLVKLATLNGGGRT